MAVWLGFCSAAACGERFSFVDATCDVLPCRAVTCNRSCRSGRDPFICLCSGGMRHTSGEAAFPRPRLGQVLTPLGVNIIALARTVITDCVKLNCYICQSEERQVIWLRGSWLWALSSTLPRARRTGCHNSGLHHAVRRCTEFLICRKRSALRGQPVCHR